jgi:DNA ligase-1
MNFVQVIQACEQASGAGSKKVIQAALAQADETACMLISAALNPYRTYGVKKYDTPAGHAKCMDHQHDYNAFFELLGKLEQRELTGNTARAAVTAGLMQFNDTTAPYIARVIDKDLKAGFSADTFNYVMLAKATGKDFDVVKKDIDKNGIDAYNKLDTFKELIPVFDQQLAEKCETEEEFDKYVEFPCQADIKYDGTRQFAFVTAEKVEYYARGGKPSNHLDGIFDAELQIIREAYGQDFVLDGEVMASDFTQTMNAKGSKNADAKKALMFRTFFIMPVSDWVAQKTNITNAMARETLEQLLTQVKPQLEKSAILLTEGRVVLNYQDMANYCNQVIDDESKTKAEREGLILKNGNAVYEWGRSYTWVKVKRFYDVDARFVSFYNGRKGSRLENTIGGANCIAFLESGEEVEFNVGSGFSDEHRKDMLENPSKWLANTHVIQYQEISKAKGKEKRSLRFCTYQRTRDDKLVEI